ncbi:MAG: hypothetical protein D6753_05450 [Planctomycetota bacterium]|nr:MAG: hypothetical protein D6753_05450 [Planctomycetota bacterium]
MGDGRKSNSVRKALVDSSQRVADAAVGGAQGIADRPAAVWYDQGIVRLWLLCGAVWAVVSSVITAATLALMVHPEWTQGWPQWSYGRLGGVSWRVAAFGLMGSLLYAGMYLSIQRLCGRAMWRISLSYLHAIVWQVAVGVGTWSALTGRVPPRLSSQWVFVADVGLGIAGGLFLWNLLMTVGKRRVPNLYISLWFYLAGALVFPVAHFLATWAAFPLPGVQVAAWAGVTDGFLQSWYRQQILFFFLLMPALGLFYHAAPQLVGGRVPRYRAAVLQFWCMVVFGMAAGARYLHWTVIPDWISTLAMWGGVFLLLPAWAGAMNGWGVWKSRTGGRGWAGGLVVVIVVALSWWAIESAASSTRTLSPYTTMNDWSLAQDWLVLYGIAGLSGALGVLWLVRRVYYVQPPAVLEACAVGPLVLGTAGWVAAGFGGGAWHAFMHFRLDAMGVLVYPDYLEIVTAVRPWWLAQAILAAVAGVGWLGVAVLIVVSRWRARPPAPWVHSMCPVVALELELPDLPASELEGKPVLTLAAKLDRAKYFAFHRRWERRAGIFIIGVIAAGLLLGGLPLWSVASLQREARKSAGAIPYTPLELMGRQIFLTEGCANCHTQMVRPLVAEAARYGEISRPEDFAFDRPTRWGSRRVGPDLAREGGKKNGYWHWLHLQNPAEVSPGSVMPSFAHLLDQKLDFDAIRQLLRTEQALGIAYDPQWLVDDELSLQDRLFGEQTVLEQVVLRQGEEVAADIVRSGGPAGMFDRQGTALIAYLQRLGNPPAVAPVQPADTQ